MVSSHTHKGHPWLWFAAAVLQRSSKPTAPGGKLSRQGKLRFVPAVADATGHVQSAPCGGGMQDSCRSFKILERHAHAQAHNEHSSVFNAPHGQVNSLKGSQGPQAHPITQGDTQGSM